MSLTLTRSPLSVIGMNGAGSGSTAKRRSARLSHEGAAMEETENQPPSKKSRSHANAGVAVQTKTADGAATASSAAATAAGNGNGTSQTSGRAKKRKQEYTEEADGFSFARKTRSKKDDSAKPSVSREQAVEPALDAAAQANPSKAETASMASAAPAQEIQSGAETADDTAPKTAKKQRKRLPTTPEHKAAQKPVRRSKRLSNENDEQQQHQQHKASPHKAAHAKSHANTDRSPSPDFRPVTVEKKRKKAGDGGAIEEEKIMRIALPFADTPIIRRNKEMRKASADKEGGRRSSGSLRGRRASSLIDEGRGNESSGTNLYSPFGVKEEDDSANDTKPNPSVLDISDSDALENEAAWRFVHDTFANAAISATALPHAEVPTSEFYKHISAELTEPRRMRCLLGWCGSRALPGKAEAPKQNTPQVDLEFQALQAARVVQEELAQELVSNGLLSDWFSRDEKVPLKPPRKKPNPRNLANIVKARELEQELERLKQERAAWDDLLGSTSPQTQQPESTSSAATCLSPVKADLLDSPQRTILEQLQESAAEPSIMPNDIQQRLRNVAENMEFSVDSFAERIHQLSTSKQIADDLADQALAGAARVLDDRERARRADSRGPGVMEGLKGLAKLLNGQRPRNGRRR